MDPQGSNGLEMAHLLKMFNKPAPLLIYINITGLQVDLEKLGDPQGRFGLEEGNPLIFQGKDIKSTGLQGRYGLEGTKPLKILTEKPLSPSIKKPLLITPQPLIPPPQK